MTEDPQRPISLGVPLSLRPLIRNVDNLYDLADEKIRTRWFWRPPYRRFLYGLPHRYRYGQHEERRHLMSVFLGMELAVGGIAQLIGAAILSRSRNSGVTTRPILMVAIGAAALIAGSVMVGGPVAVFRNQRKTAKWPFWAYHIALGLDQVLIALYCYSMGTLGAYGGIFFVWSAGYSFTFFPNIPALGYALLSATLFTVALHLGNVPVASLATFLELVGSLLVGVSFGLVVSREWSYREGTLLQLAELAHELRRPLSRIVQRSADPNLARADRERLIDTIARNTESAEEVLVSLADLLDMAKFEVSGEAIQAHRFDLVGLAKRVLALAQVEIDAAGKSMETDLRVSSCMVYADARKIERILGCLVDNARKFALSTIRIEVWEDRDAVAVRVSDDGLGIRIADSDALFRPFIRGPVTGDGGQGLGLAIARTYARQHGGDVVLGGWC